MSGRAVTVARHLVFDWNLRLVRGLPEPVARDRMLQIESDLWEHVAAHRARGASDVGLVLAILGRLLRGAPADAAWRADRLLRAGRAPRPVRRDRPAWSLLEGVSRPFDPTNGLVVVDAPVREEADDTAARMLQAGAVGSFVSLGSGGGL